MVVLFSFGFLLQQAQSQPAHAKDTYTKDWRRLDVKIIARGSRVAGSTGNMDSYLALIFDGRNHEQTAARLVHYYPSFQKGILDERIISERPLRLRLTAASYCEMDTKDFALKHVFDSDAMAKVEGQLPCFLVRE